MYVHIFRTYAAYVVHRLLVLDYTCVPYMYIYVKHMQHRYYTVPKLLLHICTSYVTVMINICSICGKKDKCDTIMSLS